MSRLRQEEFVPYAPSSVGFVRLNHDSPLCTGSSKSLKIERKEDGSISAICYRCSARGYYSAPGQKYKQATQRTNKYTEKSGVYGGSNEQQFRRSGPPRIPPDATHKLAEWGIRARHWLRKASLTQEEVEHYGLLYSPTRDSIYIPIPPGGLQIKNFSKGWTGPKYINYLPTDTRAVINSRSSTSTLCIVEDVVSAIVCSRYVDSLPLSGTYLSDATINAIKRKYNNFIVFLDDDNRQVRMRQLHIGRKLEMYGNVRIIKGLGADPKHLSATQLEELLC